MALSGRMLACFLALSSLPSSVHAQDGEAKEVCEAPTAAQVSNDEPELAITPNTVRIQSIDKPEDGRWVVMPGFSELGSPCFSRDGHWIAFDAYKEGYNNSPSECWVVRQDGGELTRLAVGATPRWSPDGTRLIFMRDEANDPMREPGIFVIDRDGQGEVRVGHGRWPDWSPDGRQIVFSIEGQPGGGLRVGAIICIAKADGSDRREVAQGDCPSWSPDGKRIAFCLKAPEQPPLIVVHNLETGENEVLGIGWFRANWMPDSRAVVCNGVVGQEIGMVRLTLGGRGRPSELPTEFDDPSSPCCSQDGQQVVFIARRPKAR